MTETLKALVGVREADVTSNHRTDSERRTAVFICYSHSDAKWLEHLQPYFKPLERQGEISVWNDTQIQPGQKWKEEIRRALGRAKVAVLLVSQAFLASDFITQQELPSILKAEKERGLTVFWIAISSCTYYGTPIEDFQAANNPEKPLDSFRPAKLKSELVKITRKIQNVIGRMHP